MTFISRREKVFDLPTATVKLCAPECIKRSDHRLKRFPSVCDDRAWTINECDRYKHFYGLVSGSQSDLCDKPACFKYIPFDVLLAILMAEKDAYINELLEMLRSIDGGQVHKDADVLYKADCYTESDEDKEDTSKVIKPGVYKDAKYANVDHKKEAVVVYVNDEKSLDVLEDSTEGPPANRPAAHKPKTYKEDVFLDAEDHLEDALIRKDAEILALKNKINGLNAELEECRDTLRKIQELENMEDLVNENSALQNKLRRSEEVIKKLEENRKILENEVASFQTNARIPLGVDTAQNILPLIPVSETADGADQNIIDRLSAERSELQRQVQTLQKELEKAKIASNDLETFKKQSETAFVNLEEVSKENESYRKKLETVKCLEKQIDELKCQAKLLTEKYRCESQKASDQTKQLNISSKELQIMREERDRLRKRVDELASYEAQYNSLQNKLHQVESIIAENELLNAKLASLDKLELENQQMRARIEQIRLVELEAAGDRERIVQLQCAIADQEEEMKDLLAQVEQMSRGYSCNDEVCRLQTELSEKGNRLKLCEQQLAEIPYLEAEIDCLKTKLQKGIDDFIADRNALKQVQADLDKCQKRCSQLEALVPAKALSKLQSPAITQKRIPIITCCKPEEGSALKDETQVVDEMEHEEALTLEKESSSSIIDLQEQIANLEYAFEIKGTMTCEEVQTLLQSLKGIISCVLEDMIEHQKEMEELEKYNQAMKSELEMLKMQMDQTEPDDVRQEMVTLRRQICEKEKQIVTLSEQISRCHNFEREMKKLKILNEKLQTEMNVAESGAADKIVELEISLNGERKKRLFAESLVSQLELARSRESLNNQIAEDLSKLHKEEITLVRRESAKPLLKEIDDLKDQIEGLKILINELKTENKLLHQKHIPYPDLSKELADKVALDDLLGKLQLELDSLRTMPKAKLDDECDALRCELKRLMDDIGRLKGDNDALKCALDSRNKARINIDWTGGKELKGGNKTVKSEPSKEADATAASEELAKSKIDLAINIRKAEAFKCENDNLKQEVNTTKRQNKNLEDELNRLRTEFSRYSAIVKDKENTIFLQKEEITRLKGRIVSSDEDLSKMKSEMDDLNGKIRSMHQIVAAKNSEIEIYMGKVEHLKDENNRSSSEVEVLRNRLKETKATAVPKANYERDLAEKHALEDAMRKLEAESDLLKRKLDEQNAAEEELTKLKEEYDMLLIKIVDLEDELGEKIPEAERSKMELQKLKEEKMALEKQMAGSFSESAEEKLLRDIVALREQVTTQQDELQNLRKENIVLKDEIESYRGAGPSSGPCPPCPPAHGRGSASESQDSSDIYYPDLDPSFEQFKNMMSIEDHQKNIVEIENRFNCKMEKLEDANSEKIKKLIEYYEKAAKIRDKTFNDNVNTVRYGYTTDIRKLTEKHKTSIMKLQGLHEDEVQELNTNYETQMEAMQTQNENVVSDLTSGAADKFKRLAEIHNKDIKDLEAKFQQLLREKETQHMFEISNLQSNLTQNMDEVEEFHKKTMDNMTQALDENVAEIQSKHNREMKRLKRGNFKRINMMRHKYEDLLTEERKKYQEQLEAMLNRLKKGNQGDHPDCECKFSGFKNKKRRDKNGPLDFLDILQKIIDEGLESLTFNEIVLVHRKTCCAAQGIVMDPDLKADLEPEVGDGCPHTPLLKADKERLLHRIFDLEDQVALKQMEIQEAIVNMELAVKTERRRLQDLRTSLHIEQQKNSELQILLSSQSKMHTDIKIERDQLERQASLHENRVVDKVKELEKERANKRCIEDELQRERQTARHLSVTLDSERERFRNQRKKDTDYVQTMRIKMEHALSNEHELKAQLDYEAQSRAKLECDLASLQRSFHLMVDLPAVGGKKEIPNISFETKKVKDKQNLNRIEIAKEEKCNSNPRTPRKTKK